MQLAVRVKPGARRDRLWREGDGLFVQIRALPSDGAANLYLIKYLSGCLRVAKSLITITRGHNSSYKIITIEARDTDLAPMLGSLSTVPPAGLFDE